MRTFRLKSSVLFTVIILSIQQCTSDPQFECNPNSDNPVPDLPDAYSTNMRLNYVAQSKTVDVRQVVNTEGNRMSIEIWSYARHVKYIRNNDQLLTLKFNSDDAPTCTVKSIDSSTNMLEPEDSGPSGIFETLLNVVRDKKKSKFFSHVVEQNHVFVNKWDACFDSPSINVSLAYSASNWNESRHSFLHQGRYIVSAEAQIYKSGSKNDFLMALFSNFNPVMPSDAEFQPPETVYCEGIKADKKPPTIPDYFSYNSELIAFESSAGIAPISSARKIFYDYPGGISRTDFYDALAEGQDLFSKVTAQGVSIIHDFNAGIQYSIDPITGSCKVDIFKATVGPVDIKETGDSQMPNGVAFFSLDASKISYNGQFFSRGYMTDVFNAAVENPKKKSGRLIYTWYFSNDKTQVVEKENIEKGVLLRLVVRPEAADGKENEVDVNFFNFAREEPGAYVYDLTSCYDDSFSKTYVLTFPANEELKGSEKLLKNYIHLALKTATGVSKQRIFVSEVFFRGKYMFAEFKILASPDVLGKNKKNVNEKTLEEAVSSLKASVSSNTFEVTVPRQDSALVLKPEPNGLNEFAGDRKIASTGDVYKEGSVIALTVGMLVLGIILGGVALNLAMSRRFGVSLFQKKTYNKDPFSNFNNESSM